MPRLPALKRLSWISDGLHRAPLLALWPLLAVTVLAQPPHLEQLSAKLQRDLDRIATAAPGVVGISVVDISPGKRLGVNDGLVFPPGSAIKIPILIELYRRADRGELRLTDRAPLRRSDQVGGSGLLQYFSDGGSDCRSTTSPSR